MPLLEHFHPPLQRRRRWEGFHHAWAASIAHQLNQAFLPPDWFAEPEISLGPTMEIDVATIEPPSASYGIRVYQHLGGAELRAAIELISPANKDREGSRRTFAAKCAGYLKHGVSVLIVDIVTARAANLHAELFDVLEVKTRQTVWQSPTGLYAIAYRPVTVHKAPRVEVWPEPLTLGQALPVLPLWLALDLCMPLNLEESYLATCHSLRIPA